MADLRSPRPEETASPWFSIAMVLVVLVGVAGVTLILSDGKDQANGAPAAGATAHPGGGNGGRSEGYQPLPLFPQSPVGTSSPVGDPPAVTIIQDTREMLYRLPLDRNHPKGWTNPSVPKQPGSR